MSCDGGQRQRLVLCIVGDAAVDVSKCDHNSRPDDREDCNQRPCSDGRLSHSSISTSSVAEEITTARANRDDNSRCNSLNEYNTYNFAIRQIFRNLRVPISRAETTWTTVVTVFLGDVGGCYENMMLRAALTNSHWLSNIIISSSIVVCVCKIIIIK